MRMRIQIQAPKNVHMDPDPDPRGTEEEKLNQIFFNYIFQNYI